MICVVGVEFVMHFLRSVSEGRDVGLFHFSWAKLGSVRVFCMLCRNAYPTGSIRASIFSALK